MADRERYLVQRDLVVVQDLMQHRRAGLDHKEADVVDTNCNVAIKS